jgi:hypothetical protein
VEDTRGDAFRWTAPECSLLLSLRGQRLCLEAAVDRPSDTCPVELRILAFGHEVGRAPLEPGGQWREIALALPPDLPRGPTQLRLITSHSWRPADTGHGQDTRALGIRIRRIWSE